MIMWREVKIAYRKAVAAKNEQGQFYRKMIDITL